MTQREVILEGGLPWGFRMHGGDDLKTPLKVSRVNPGSKAAQRGIREGDLITSINGQNTKNLTNNEAHNLLKNSGSTLKLGLNEDIEGSPKRRQYRTIHQETHQETIKRSSLSYSIQETVEKTSSRKENNNKFESFKRTSSEFVNGRETKQNGRDIRVVTNIPVSQKSTPSSSSASTPSTLIPEGRNISSDHALASRQSSYSNCSSIPDEGLEQESQDYQDREYQVMDNGQARWSSSKKRRQRRKHNLLNRSISQERQSIVEIKEVTSEDTTKNSKGEIGKVSENINKNPKENIETASKNIPKDLEDKVENVVKSDEATQKNIEILRLKRVEHKYKVESPKEVRVEQIKSSDKKLKAKSKSLDDDDILRIQELSEASESEDAKPQANIIISEASSEENLLDESDSELTKKRKGLDSMCLQLNDNNQIEAVSHISPAEEQALRTFLGGLNLVQSPEESAKDLYERTSGPEDAKAKKLQKRKELEEYFLPIAENPRFLDAISEEASDVSDKEGPSTSRIIHHIKQCTPEQDLLHVAPLIPPREHKSNTLGKWGGQVEQPGAVLVETKILEPENVQETVCRTQVGKEKAEVVYIADSSESSTSSGDFEEAFDRFQQENEPEQKVNCISSLKENAEDKTTDNLVENRPVKTSDKEDNKIQTSPLENLDVVSNESLKTTFLSHTSSSIKTGTSTTPDAQPISFDTFSQLTPPLTPDDTSNHNEKPGNGKVSNQVFFDYTKIPNVLFGKEPNSNIKNLKRDVEDIIKGNNVSKDVGVGLSKGKNDENISENTSNNENITEIRHVAAMHVSKKTVNGQLDNMECRKVNVDEIFKNGDVQVEKNFEEFKTNQTAKPYTSSITKDIESVRDNYKESKTNNNDVSSKNINNVFNASDEIKTEDQKHKKSEIKNIETDKLIYDVNGHLENIKVQEGLIDKDSTRKNTQTNENTTTVPDGSTHCSQHCYDNKLLHKQEFLNIYNNKKDYVLVAKNSTSEKISNANSFNKFTTIKTEFLKESINENVLKHVIMTSQDSNKTDSQKLNDFNNLCMLNNEIKDKINRRELIGPSFRKSKSPGANGTTVMHCVDLPEKTFVERRVKEFSSGAYTNEKETKEESVLRNFLVHNGTDNATREEPVITRDLVKSRIGKLSQENHDNIIKEEKNEGSVLKRIISADTDKTNVLHNKGGENEEIIKPKETVIPVSIAKPNGIDNYQEYIENKNIQGYFKDDTASIPKKKLKTTEQNLMKSYDEMNKSSEHNILNKLTKTSKDVTIKSENEENTNKNVPKQKRCQNKEIIIPTKGKEVNNKEKIIPITIEEEQKNENAQNIFEKEKIIPIKLEDNDKIQGATNTKYCKIIPISVEKLNNKEKWEKSNQKESSKLLENIVVDRRETNKIKEKIIPVSTELNEPKETVYSFKTKKGTDKVTETVIPIIIQKTNLKEENKQTNLKKSSESLDQNIARNTELKYSGNEKIIPNTSEASKKNNKKLVENVDTHLKNTEKIIPIKIEAEINKNIPTNTDVPTKSLKELNESLGNIAVGKKTETQANLSEKIETLDEVIKKVRETPPVPPPRRSRNILLKKEYENKNTPQNTTLQEQNKITKEINQIDLKERNPVSSDIYTNVVSPPRPSSAGSDSSDSEESSRCTAKYNPNSSIADVTSITKEEEEEESSSEQKYQPMSLRNIVLNVFMSLPFGEEILRELAEVSKSIDYFTNKIPFKRYGSIISDKNNDVLVNKEESMPGPWYTQKDVVRNEYGDDKHKILELHEKFSTRRKYMEGENSNVADSDNDRVMITGIGSRETEVLSPNRLLTIIREEPSETDIANDYLYFEDKTNDTLNAKNLGEWLTLARHKSKSTSNLDSTNIPINNLRRTFATPQTENAKFSSNTRRRSLPQEIYEKQLIEIMEKERDIQRELEKLEEEKRKLRAEIAPSRQKEFQMEDFVVSKKGDFAIMREHGDTKQPRPTSMPVFPTEFFRQQMYDEYMDKFSEREERKQQKVIKISTSNDLEGVESQNILKSKEVIHPIEIEKEFMDKVKQKLGKSLNVEESVKTVADESDGKTSDDPPVIVLDGDKVKGVETLPKHLQEFVGDLTALQEESIWSPGQQRYPQTTSSKQIQRTESQNSQNQDEPISPIWTPKSANSSPTVERKEFRAVNFQSPVLSRKNRTKSETIQTPDSTTSEPPWRLPEGTSDTALNLSSTLDRRLTTSQSSPGFGSFSTSPRLPKAQNPTITLLQKAREGQLPRGAHYIDQDRRLPNDRPPIKYPGEVLYHIKNEYTSESDSERPRKMADLSPRKFEGIGPTSKDGMPLILRSEVKDKDQSKWYKRMYDTIHKQKPHRDEFVTVRYKQKRAQYPYTSGYLSEPEPGAYDSDFTDYKYQTLDRRRTPQTQEYISNSSTMPRSVPDKSYSSSDIIRNTQEKYHPGRIENYMPGRSSISEREAKQWWDEVMDIFDGHLEQQSSRVPPKTPRSFMNQALKESGYESDSTLVFRRKEDTASQLSPKEQKQAYKIIQKGGDVPFQGLRKPAPERPKEPDLPPPPPPPKSQGGVRNQEPESPRKYVENEVTIHYKTPVRTEVKEYVSEDELAHRQAEAMKKIYEEERKRKYLQVSQSLQELQDMKSRRHTDNFIPSQKSPISLNRYDDFDDLNTPTKTRPKSPEPRLVARALYNFVGQTARELTFRKGDLIYVRRQVDKNWYEGELNAMVGLFPVNYVEIVPYEGPKTTPRKAHEGQARAKYNFVAQTHLELSLAKGELVTITKRVDDNWFEGKIGGRKGIFPVAYVEVLIDPSDPIPPSSKPVAAPAAHSLLLNGSAQGKDSMGSHLYTPNTPNPISTRDTGFHHAKPVQLSGTGTYSTLPKSSDSPINQTLHIETQSDPVPYRALYRYTPQNDDELELLEGDTVYVLEKCDDGWYVGSSDRTGAFGTFPGNYVEKI